MSDARYYARIWSTILAVVGWAGAVGAWSHFGIEAGIRPSFIFALSVAIAFTMVASQCWALPHKAAREEQAAIYALGFAEGMSCGACPLRPAPEGGEPEPTRLRSVR